MMDFTVNRQKMRPRLFVRSSVEAGRVWRTYKTFFCAVAIALGAAPIAATAADPRPCDLFSAPEITSVTGVAPAGGQPGPDVDESRGATAWTCGWLVGKRYFAARVLRFRSAADATRAMTSTSQILKSFPDGIQLSAVPGPGGQAMWGSSSEEGAMWIVRTGRTVLAVMLAGELKRPEDLREALRQLVASGLGRLP